MWDRRRQAHHATFFFFFFFFNDNCKDKEQSAVTIQSARLTKQNLAQLHKASMAMIIHHLVRGRDVPISAATGPELQQRCCKSAGCSAAQNGAPSQSPRLLRPFSRVWDRRRQAHHATPTRTRRRTWTRCVLEVFEIEHNRATRICRYFWCSCLERLKRSSFRWLSTECHATFWTLIVILIDTLWKLKTIIWKIPMDVYETKTVKFDTRSIIWFGACEARSGETQF